MGPYDAALDSPCYALEFQCLSWPFLGLRFRGRLTYNFFHFPNTSHWSNPGVFFRISEWPHEKSILVLKGTCVTPGTRVCIGKVCQGPPRAVRAPESHFGTPKKPTLAKFGQIWVAFSPLTKQIGWFRAQHCTQVPSMGGSRAACKRYVNNLILNCFSAPFRPKLTKIDTFPPPPQKKGFKVDYNSK